MLGQLDQQPLFNAVNFSRSIFASANATIFATGLEVLWCPSDPSIRMEVEYPFFEDPFKEKIRFSSYAGCTGIWYPGPVSLPRPAEPRADQPDQRVCSPRTAAFSFCRDHRRDQPDDALERAGARAPDRRRLRLLALVGRLPSPSDTRFWTIFPMNPFRKMPDTPETYSSAYTSSASSFHPNGAYFAFADGSVRFLKDSINSWATDAQPATRRGVAGCQRVLPCQDRHSSSESTRSFPPVRATKCSRQTRTEPTDQSLSCSAADRACGLLMSGLDVGL